MHLCGYLSSVGLAMGVATVSVAAAPETEKFALNCLVCHGADLRGVEGLGVNLFNSTFVGSKSVAELVAFLKVGRLPDDPASVTRRAMPGFAWVAEADLTEIATYIKSRHGS